MNYYDEDAIVYVERIKRKRPKKDQEFQEKGRKKNHRTKKRMHNKKNRDK